MQLIIDDEERKLKGLTSQLIELQLQKLEIKLRCFEDMDQTMRRQYAQISEARKKLVADRLRFQQEKAEAEKVRKVDCGGFLLICVF